MRRLSSLAVATAVFLPLAAAVAESDDPFKNTDCKAPKTQMELDYCAGQDFQAADKKLNALYRKLMTGYDAKNQAMLKSAEKAWLSYRDSECEFETAVTEGGTIHSMEQTMCSTAKTEARIKELQAQANCAEGDLSCNPPVK